jgi:hypothetical protein
VAIPLYSKFLFDDKKEVVLVYRKIPLLVAIKVLRSFFGCVATGVVPKVEPFHQKFLTAHPCFALRIEFHQNSSIPPQSVIDVPDVIGHIAIQPVVKRISTLI